MILSILIKNYLNFKILIVNKMDECKNRNKLTEFVTEL